MEIESNLSSDNVVLENGINHIKNKKKSLNGLENKNNNNNEQSNNLIHAEKKTKLKTKKTKAKKQLLTETTIVQSRSAAEQESKQSSVPGIMTKATKKSLGLEDINRDSDMEMDVDLTQPSEYNETGGKGNSDIVKEKILSHRCRFVRFLNSKIIHLNISCKKKNILVGKENGNILIFEKNKSNCFFHSTTLFGSPKDGLQVVQWVGESRVFSAGLSSTINEWDLKTGKVCSSTASYGGAVWSMSLSPSDQAVMAVGCQDGVIRLFRVLDHGLEYLSALERQSTKVLCIAWHPQKPILVVGGTDGKVRVVHVDTGRTIHHLTLDGAFAPTHSQARLKPTNDPTIIWNVLVLKDGTIVCADSSGCVSFWHGPTGTLIKKIKAHEADVLCLTASSSGARVYSSGVDRKICEFKSIDKKTGTGSRKEWVLDGQKRYHTHDVNALCLIEDKVWDLLVSGGVDTNMILSGPTAEFSVMKQQRLEMTPQYTPISLAKEKRLIMCRFDESIKIWELAATRNFEIGNHVNYQRIYGHESHQHLLTIKCGTASNLVASDISQDGSLVVVSTATLLKLFYIVYPTRAAQDLTVKVQQIKSKILNIMGGAHCVLFTPDGGQLVVAGSADNSITVYDVNNIIMNDEDELMGDDGCHHVWSVKTAGRITTMAISDDSRFLVCSCTTAGSTTLSTLIVSYDLVARKQHAVVPSLGAHTTSMVFRPGTCELGITTVSNGVFMIDISENQLTPWSRRNYQRMPPRFTNRKETIRGVSFPGKDKMCVWGYSYTMFVDLQRNIAVYQPVKKKKREGRGDKAEVVGRSVMQEPGQSLGVDHRFQAIMYVGTTSDGELVVVERPILQVVKELPAAFKKKKFGR